MVLPVKLKEGREAFVGFSLSLEDRLRFREVSCSEEGLGFAEDAGLEAWSWACSRFQFELSSGAISRSPAWHSGVENRFSLVVEVDSV